MVKHTPGPWLYRMSHEDCCDYEVYTNEGQSVDIVAGEYGIASEEDARLIAASTDLLAAAKEVIRLFNYTVDDASDAADFAAAVEIQIEAAISKAEGRS